MSWAAVAGAMARGCCLVLAAGAAHGIPFEAASGSDATPLLSFAARLHFESMPNEALDRRRLESAQHELARDPPPPGRCGATLAAPRYAELFTTLAEARGGLGDSAGAAEAYGRAVECAPRDAQLRGDLCIELMNLDRHAESRQAAERGIRIDARDYTSNSCLAQIDFLEEHWAEAVPRIRRLVSLSPDAELATYWQILLWLAERRAGTAEPALVRRDLTTLWPRPVLDYLRGKRDEAALRAELEQRDAGLRQREQLCEALYYVGEARLAAGDEPMARRYFAATVNLKVLYFSEHHLAAAALRRASTAAGGASGP